MTLMNIADMAPNENPACYEFIWRTTSTDSKYAILEEVIEGHFSRYYVRVEPSTIRIDKFPKVRGRNLSYIFQHKAIVEFTERV
ncbi:MAG: hypothetical protein P1Q69_17835 [Candidatus Thorarchaeota archaeon]|nr:hypothetical protein [Candidatus Thorarchaeota archaeon]